MDWSAVTQRVWELTEPLAATRGLELIDVQFRPEAGRVVLRLLLDRPAGGVTLAELGQVSRELGDLLDGHEAVPGRYQLECSSPGLNRPLLRETHFQRALGQRVQVRTREVVVDRRGFHGTLERVDAGGIVVRDPAVGVVEIPFAVIEKANTEYQFTRPPGGPPAHA